jgi:hypothetical protein
LVVASTVGLARVTSYGTIFYQLVSLSAWAILAKLASGAYANTHDTVLWIVASATNLTVFLIPEAVIWFSTRKRWPVICFIATCVWCGFYLLSLFWLFPATDGP